MTMEDRIEGATLPGYTATIQDAGTVITDGLDYTWIAEASTYAERAVLWTKNSDITPAADGFTVIWADADIGSLTSPSIAGTRYIIEFTGTRTADGQTIKHQETVTIRPQVT